MEQLTGSKLRREYEKAIQYRSVYLTYMQSTSRDTPGWMNDKPEPRVPGETSTTSDIQMISR